MNTYFVHYSHANRFFDSPDRGKIGSLASTVFETDLEGRKAYDFIHDSLEHARRRHLETIHPDLPAKMVTEIIIINLQKI
jgi:hypothetical protein